MIGGCCAPIVAGARVQNDVMTARTILLMEWLPNGVSDVFLKTTPAGRK
jgi:hypothetical protein